MAVLIKGLFISVLKRIFLVPEVMQDGVWFHLPADSRMNCLLGKQLFHDDKIAQISVLPVSLQISYGWNIHICISGNKHSFLFANVSYLRKTSCYNLFIPLKLTLELPVTKRKLSSITVFQDWLSESWILAKMALRWRGSSCDVIVLIFFVLALHFLY